MFQLQCISKDTVYCSAGHRSSLFRSMDFSHITFLSTWFLWDFFEPAITKSTFLYIWQVEPLRRKGFNNGGMHLADSGIMTNLLQNESGFCNIAECRIAGVPNSWVIPATSNATLHSYSHFFGKDKIPEKNKNPISIPHKWSIHERENNCDIKIISPCLWRQYIQKCTVNDRRA